MLPRSGRPYDWGGPACYQHPARDQLTCDELMSRTIDLTGQRFGRLVAIRRGQPAPSGHRQFWCECDCGLVCLLLLGSNLRLGKTQSCGCLRREAIGGLKRSHGQSRTVEYKTWFKTKERCLNPSDRSFEHYGGRGLMHGFPTFEDFLAELGPRPSKKHSIERIDNEIGYLPGNVKWGTPKEQNRNKRNSALLTWQGETLCITAWAERLGVRSHTLAARLKRGWSVEDALFVPVIKGQKHQASLRFS